MPEHRLIPEDGLHEPKGASTASANTTYISNGAGSGTWKQVDANTLQGSLSNTDAAGQWVITDGAGGVYPQTKALTSDLVTYNGTTVQATLIQMADQIKDLQDRVTALEGV